MPLAREVRHLDGRRGVAELELDALPAGPARSRRRSGSGPWRVAMPLASTAEAAGTSSRSIGVIAPRSMRPMRSSDPLERPGSRTACVRRAGCAPWPRARTRHCACRASGRLRTSRPATTARSCRPPTGPEPVPSPSSGAVMVCTGSSPSRFEEMPKSVSAGHP